MLRKFAGVLPNGPPSRNSSTVNDTNFLLSLAGVAECINDGVPGIRISLESISVNELYLLPFREFHADIGVPADCCLDKILL